MGQTRGSATGLPRACRRQPYGYRHAPLAGWLLATAGLLACAGRPDAASDAGPTRTRPHDGRAAQDAADAANADAAQAPHNDASTDADLDDSSNDDGGDTDTMTEDDGGAIATARSTLVLPGLWSPVDAASDPFADRPATVSCAEQAVMAELLAGELTLGVDTGSCDYLTATQPTLRAVAADEILQVRVWHFELNAPAPASAHVAVMIDDVTLLDQRVDIPQAGGLLLKQVRAPRAIPAGAPAYFHLHNHGANSWALVEVSAGSTR